ncbi:MAG: bile acid:sodium symporter [Methanosphaera sp.]|nr:bile acid:sodium symporter [Methanosphaera sp.]
MKLFEKLEPAFIFMAVILGLLFNNIDTINRISPYLITIFLSLMLFALFLDIAIEDIGHSFSNLKFTGTSLIINFIWTPLFGYFLANIFLNGNIDLIIGFFMLILTPCTDWYLVFTKMANGDLSSSISLLPINLALQLILLPGYLLLFFSSSNTLELNNLIYGMITYIVIPFTLAQVVKYFLRNRKYKEKIISSFTDNQLLFLCIAIFGLFNSESSVLIENIDSIGVLFIPLILFFITNTVIDYYISRGLKFSYEEYASLTFTTLARNSPLALAVAISSFAHNELIAISLVIGPLIELPTLYVISKVLLVIRKNYWRE